MAPEKTTVGYLPGSDPDAIKANLALQQAQQRLQQALEARQSRMFDPELLAMAQGFLAPTQTGGFGESLGMVAKNVREAQAQQEKEEREIAQAQLGLATQGLELERRKQRDKAFTEAISSMEQPSGALPGAEAGRPFGAPITGPLSAPRIGDDFVAIQIAPPDRSFKSGLDYLKAAYKEGNISLADAYKQMGEIQRKRYIDSPGRYVDLATGIEYISRSGAPVDVQIFDPDTGEPRPGTYKVDPGTAAALAHYASKRDAESYEKIARAVLEGPGVAKRPETKPSEPSKPGEPPKAAEPAKPGEPPKPPEGRPAEPGAPRTRLYSTQELETMAAEAKEEAQLEAKRRIGEKSEYLDAGRTVTNRMGTIAQLYPIASGKNAEQIFGVFEDGKVSSAFLKLVEGGIGTRSFQVSLSNLRSALTDAGLPKELISQAQMAYSLMAQIQLETAKLGQGQGAVSNFERDLFAQASIARSDRPEVILAKLDMLKARANLDKERSRLVRQYRGKIDDLVESEQWSNLTNNYLNELSQIFGNRLSGAPISQNPRMPAPPGRDNAGADARLPPGVR